ncbi:MAG TPA: hypothetical protein VF092_23515 [Longimicrobium sp.]
MRRILSISALLLAGACSDPVGSGGVRVLPDQEIYATFGNDQPVTIRYTVANTGSGAIDVLACEGRMTVEIQFREGADWVTYNVPVIPECGGSTAAVRVAPGSSAADSVVVQGIGTWRLRVPYRRQGTGGNTADSREFKTRVPLD